MMSLAFFFPQTGLPVWGSYSFQRVASLGRMILPLSPGLRSSLGALGRMILNSGGSGPHDFTFVSHLSPTLVSHSGCSGPHALKIVSHLSPTLVSHSGCSGPHAFSFVSHLSPTLVSHSGCSGPHAFTLVSHLSPTLVSHSGCSGPHDFTLVSHLSPTLVFHSGVLWAAWSYTCLPHLSPTAASRMRRGPHSRSGGARLTLVSHSGCSGLHDFTLVSHMCIPHLSPTLGALGRVIFLSPTLAVHSGRSSPTCLEIVSRSGCSGCSGPHDFTLVSRLSPALVFHSACSGPRAFKHLSPTLVCLSGWSGRHDFTFVFHLTSTVLLVLFTINFIHIWGLCWCNQL